MLCTCPVLAELNLRGCERVLYGFASTVATAIVPARPSLRRVDVSHTFANDTDLISLLERLPRLRGLQINFNQPLSDVCLDALPPTLVRVEAMWL